MAFKIAGSMAFQEGVKKANPVLMEPIMKVVVVTPEDFMGDVIGDLNSKRGRVESMEDLQAGIKEITALCRLAKCLATPLTCEAHPGPRQLKHGT
jgi:elongation factor G